MRDHYRTSLDYLSEVVELENELDLANEANAGAKAYAQLHHRIGVALKLAEIHSNLAAVKAVSDVGLNL